jgi:hypothetical protein
MLPDRLTESYIITSAHRDIGKYGERFIDVLNHAVSLEKSGTLTGGILAISRESDGSRFVTFSIKRILAYSLDRNYADAEDTLRKLESVFIEYREDGVWRSRALVTDPDIDEINHTAKFRVPAEIWSAVQNKETGFRLYAPRHGYDLTTEYAYRLYKLVCCGERKPVRYSLVELKAILGCEDKYKRVVDFADRVLEPSKQDLMAHAEYYFEYKFEVSKDAQKKSSGRGRRAYDQVAFFPHINRNVTEGDSRYFADETHNLNQAEFLPGALHDYLVQKFGFTDTEITNSRTIVPAFDILRDKNPNLLALLIDNVEILDSAKGDKKAWVISYIKQYVFTQYDIALGSEKSFHKLKKFGSKERRGELASTGDLFGTGPDDDKK